jgi:tRNA(Ile)-lysidine synthase
MLSSYGFNFSDVKSIVKSLDKQSGKTFMSGTHRLIKDRDFLIIEKTNDKAFKAEETLIEKDLKILYEPIRLEFDHLSNEGEMLNIFDKNIAFIDNDKLSYPLILRKWKKGDHFYPLGMRGKKLISDYLIDKKLTVFEKEKIWLLLSANHIVWIVGHRIDNRFKVTGETKNVICIKAIC